MAVEVVVLLELQQIVEVAIMGGAAMWERCNRGTGRPCLTKESSRLARLSEGGVGRVG